MVEAIAKAGLDHPDKIAVLMHTKLEKKTEHFERGQCPARRAADIDNYTPENDVWSIASPEDSKDATRQWPGSRGPLGSLKFAYSVQRDTFCSTTGESPPNIFARIEFQQVGGFCVLPNGHRPASTWNVDAFGPRPTGYRKENGVQVSFFTIIGDECFETVTISQGNQPYGSVF